MRRRGARRDALTSQYGSQISAVGIVNTPLSDAGRGNEPGTIAVSWVPLAAPWVSYKLLVDGEVVGHFGYRRPVLVEVVPGVHEVGVRHWRYSSNIVSVAIADSNQVTLYAGTRGLPPGAWFPWDTLRWARENSILWLSDLAAPPTLDPSPIAVRADNRSVSKLRFAVLAAAIVVFGASAIIAVSNSDYVKAALALAFIVPGVLLTGSRIRARRRTESRPPD